MQRLFTLVGRLEAAISYSAMAALALAVLWGVLTRYITERPAVWTTEMTGVLFTWAVFLGASSAYRRGRHIEITLFVDALPKPAASAIRLIAQVTLLAFLAYATYLSYGMMMKGATRVSPVLRLSFFWVYLAALWCFAIMTLATAARLLGLIARPELDSK